MKLVGYSPYAKGQTGPQLESGIYSVLSHGTE
jgi:hypothetical protein